MAQPKLTGKPQSLTVGTPAVTITNIVSARRVGGPDLIADKSGVKVVPRYLRGDETSRGIRVVTRDVGVKQTLEKGTLCTAVELTLTGAKLSDGTTHTAGTAKRTLSYATQVNDLEDGAETGAQPQEIELLFLVCQANDSNETEGTVTDTFFT